jgi:hypothetical protein
MATMLTVPSVPQQVTLSGIVVDGETSARLSGVTATITTSPVAFQSLLAKKQLQYGALWDTLRQRPDRTSTSTDGSFAFVDLPDGAYVVTFSAPRRLGLYGSPAVPFTVAHDAQGNVVLTTPLVRMPPTAVRGLVNGKPPHGGARDVVAPIPGARARVRGSGEIAHTRRDGRFYLPTLEEGTLTLEISAPNYAPVARPMVIASGTITDLGTVTLTPSSHA